MPFQDLSSMPENNQGCHYILYQGPLLLLRFRRDDAKTSFLFFAKAFLQLSLIHKLSMSHFFKVGAYLAFFMGTFNINVFKTLRLPNLLFQDSKFIKTIYYAKLYRLSRPSSFINLQLG